ncbi:hypothetical protein EV659_12016 [Rhodothalassium salexigens DSM 2132]|uniref:Uncharacterized protein n=2 Tax=Rhodothalassium salexigens TaxID=1086 RepID=A0A4R2P6A2_RHOSA|nr:BrnT family toxin [Rhodothalassium salexigens]MBB4212816.1 hypothetical protein [Rhodothalassium salexigens DSM 2132]MBK1640260.1 hypothetical protein [Rhodothalassium salexigens DSM 2132]TCP29511.1 hypothetical protein EV659_12016 [Rhodothalassium salexigens DSM 2132]
MSGPPSYDWDDAKSAARRARSGHGFDLVEWFDWDSALIVRDQRRDYGEQRYRAFGLIDGRLFCLVFTPRGDRLRVISLRRANARERQAYDRAKDPT